jgi:glucose-1-phosphate cytidylyltransferase
MKVVLLCGGLGMRLREVAENVPKPMVPLGPRPIVWHLMKYYAHFGHNEFILCLGCRGDLVKQYFLNYHDRVSNDFTLSASERRRERVNSDIEDWRITFADTGLSSNVGQRLMAVRRHVENEEMFLANYADGLTDLHLPDQLEHLRRSHRIASFLSVKPNLSYHVPIPMHGASSPALPRSPSPTYA